MHLSTLGRAQVAAGRIRIGPEAPVAFPLLLHLALERDRAVPRVRLQELLFPEQSAANASHSLRQSVYKLRTQGFPIEGSGGSMHIAAGSIHDDYSALLTPQYEGTRDLNPLMGGWLPGFEPSVSPAYSHWFEEKRAEIGGRIRSTLLSEVVLHKRHGRWQALEQTCRAVLLLDPLNEEATLGLAEALALSGSKVEAVRVLERYQEEVPTSELRVSASILKRRISERTPERPPERKQPIFVGREKEMEALTDALGVALSGVPTGVIVHGEPGIGKTRLLQEASGWAAINGFRIATHTCRPHDVKRPLGVFTGLVPQLRAMPGALGCAPETLALLSRFEGSAGWRAVDALGSIDADHVSALVCAAVEELIDSVLAETPVLCLLDDSHWADEASLDLLVQTSRALKGRFAFMLAGRSVPLLLTGELGSGLAELQLKPLESPASHELFLTQYPGSDHGRSVAAEWAESVSGGNPLFLVTLARQPLQCIAERAIPTELAHLLEGRIQSLTPSDANVFASISVLGGHATHRALEKLLSLSRHELLAAISRLEDGGFVVGRENRLEPAHPLFAEHSLKRLGSATRRYLYHAGAEVLRAEAKEHPSSSILWDLIHLTRLSGNGAEVAVIARECATNAMSLGQASDACDLLLEARHGTLSPDARRALTNDLLAAALSCGRWQLVKECAEEVARSSPGREEDRLAEIQCAALEAEWHIAHNHLQVVGPLQALLTTPQLSDTSRIRAAELVTICAVNLNDESIAARARKVAETLIGGGLRDPHCWGLLMIYEASFGDLESAESHARTLLGLLAAAPPSQQTIRLRMNAAAAIRFAGRFGEGMELLKGCYYDTRRSRLGVLAHRSAHEASFAYLCRGDIPNAKTWLEASERAIVDAMPHLDLGEDAESRFWVAFEEGRYDEAFEHAKTVLRLSDGRSLRLINAAKTTFELARLHAERIQPSTEIIDELITEYKLSRAVLGSDLYSVGLFRLLESCGRRAEARQLAREYVRIRRERFPICPYLATLTTGSAD